MLFICLASLIMIFWQIMNHSCQVNINPIDGMTSLIYKIYHFTYSYTVYNTFMLGNNIILNLNNLKHSMEGIS